MCFFLATLALKIRIFFLIPLGAPFQADKLLSLSCLIILRYFFHLSASVNGKIRGEKRCNNEYENFSLFPLPKNNRF